MEESAGELAELVRSLEDFEPTIPEELVRHIGRRYGCDFEDPNLAKLVALAAQQSVWSTLEETQQLCRVRKGLPMSRLKELGHNPRDKRPVLLTEDVVKALKERGVTVPYMPYQLDDKATTAAPPAGNKKS
ncbi:unnamed protein product [Ostreobium quekettii]|uniref:Uncharacterized protein n=1 Tax=Ostreobium quekettii TaxID=121088 RepID=A0A8S1JFQ7_9CHLO|nr:unnamed protein product [Ostreobium quekettii]|eukprot:evm.model.scf_193.2 EVM.evm.TU.scf_193.2   scf_193:21421-24711(+)